MTPAIRSVLVVLLLLFVMAAGGAILSGVAAAPSPETGYRSAIARTAPSVVSVYGAGEISPDGLGANVPTLAIGSGVVIDKSGFVVTSGRLFRAGEQLMVALRDGTPCAAAIVGIDAASGLALLRIDAAGLQPVEMADMADVAVGDIVLAIGNPPGVGQVVSQGIVGAIGRNLNGIERYIETDATILPGGYGGALVDRQGRLVGIIAVAIAIGDETPAMRLAIPADRVGKIVARLKLKGRAA